MENKDQREEFNKKFPCIQEQCDNNGTIRGSNGDPEQCQYCYEYRLPIISLIESILQSKQERVLGEIDKVRIPKEYEINGNHYRGYDYKFAIGYNQALDDLKPIISNLLK